MTRNCVGCGGEFQPRRSDQIRCVKDCGRTSQQSHRARSESRAIGHKVFIGVDGEGVTYCANCETVKGESLECDECGNTEWKHDYVLLTVGDNEPLYRRDGGHLHYRDIFAYLYRCFLKNPDAVYVGFFLSYDFTQWLRTLPEGRAKRLLTKEGIAARKRNKSGGNTKPFPVYVGTQSNPWEWEIDTLGFKRFSIRPGTGFPPNVTKNTAKTMVICDAGPFFQAKFTSVIEPYVGSLITQEEYDTVLAGKTRRSSAKLDVEMLEYNALENDILSRVMTQLNEGFVAAGIKLNKTQWYGPGQAAQEWLNKIGAPTGEQVREVVPSYAIDAARKTYYGGWFEIFRHGIIPGDSYEYDINSAYPYVISRLPCLLHGRWQTGNLSRGTELKELPPGSIRMLHGLASGSDPYVGALPHRTDSGRVMRPLKTSGWYWEHEIEAAKRAGIIDTFDADEFVQYDPCSCPPPFSAIAEMYELRLQVGKNTPRGKAYKLIYNSAYGKMAQSIGEPKYSNSIYASLITTGCRTMILEAIATHPKKTTDLLMVATDGVYFRSPHPSLDIDPERLGAWDGTVKKNLTLFMPGIYWDDKTRDMIKQGKNPKLKSRGISASDLAACVKEIDRQFKRMKMGDEWPSLTIPIKFNMVTALLALHRNKWEECGKVILDGVKKVSANPSTKRYPEIFPDDSGDKVIMTCPYPEGFQLETTPYDKRFGAEMEEFMLEDEEVSPEGLVRVELMQILTMK